MKDLSDILKERGIPHGSASPKEAESEKDEELTPDEKSIMKALRTRAWKGTVEDAEGKRDPNYVAQALTDQKELTGRLIGMLESRKPEGGDKFSEHLEKELQELKTKLEADSPDPIALISETEKRLDELAGALKKRLGLADSPGTSRASTTDFPAMLELERLRGDREEQARRHDRELAEDRRRWEVEQDERRQEHELERIRWANEFKLSIAKLKLEKESKGKALDSLEAVAGAIIDGLGEEKGYAKRACPDCGEELRIPPKAKTVTCRACGEVHEVKRKAEAPHKTEVESGEEEPDTGEKD